MLSSNVSSKFLLVAVTAAVATAALAEAASIPASIQKRPNIIVIQPDDHLFLEEWTPPARFERQTIPPTSLTSILNDSADYISPVPNINRIKNHGLEMTNAYAASTMCGTSRYSTLTGRLPSRSSYGRQIDQSEWYYFDGGNDDDFSSLFLRDVTIPKTKLEDTWGVPDSNDCTSNNLAAALKQNGYSTGVVGKWHLENTEGEQGALYDYYPWVQDKVRNCGFDFAEAIYRENLNNAGGEYNVDGGFVTHNMEHLTAEAIRFIHESQGVDMPSNDKKKKKEETIDETQGDRNPFFLYFNPTVPHESGDVTDALRTGDCQNTVQGWIPEAPYVPYGMTADFKNCYEYRQSVLERAAASEASLNRDKLAGAVWIDDAIGSLFQTLEALEILDNTLILFQLDHGMDAKGSLFEGGSRIVQFVHYPDQIKVDHQNNSDNIMLGQDDAAAASPQGWKFEGLVSTIDVAPTLMDLAGVPLAAETAEEGQPRYQMDGKSWFSEMLAANAGNSEDFLPQKQQRQQKPMPVEENYFQERCLFTEEGLDRSVRCGCYKYIYISDPSSGFTVREANLQGVYLNNHNYFNLCDEDTGKYITSPESSPELWPTYYSNRISNDVKNQLWNKVACLAKQTDPSKSSPDYETDCGLPLTGISSVGPSVIEAVDNESPDDLIEDSPVSPELDEPASLDIIEEPQPREPFLRSPTSSSTTSALVDTMPKYAIALIVLVLLLVPCFLYWVYREICRRVVLAELYRSKGVAPISDIAIDSKGSSSSEQMKEIENNMLRSAIGTQGNRHLVAGSTSIQKTGQEIAQNYGSDYSRSSNPMIWRKLADEFRRQANLRAKWNVYTVSGIVVGTSSNSVATDLTMDTSEQMMPSSMFDNNHQNSDEESNGTEILEQNNSNNEEGKAAGENEASNSDHSSSTHSARSRRSGSSGEFEEV